MKLKHQLVPIIGFILIFFASFLYQRLEDAVSRTELILVFLVSLCVYILLVALYTWFHTKPYEIFSRQREEYERLHMKIKATVDKLIQKQRFIDQSILSVIEGEAENIWVITTKLANELADEDLQRAVMKNLEEGKRYTYFLPHPDDLQFRRIERNLSLFKKLDLYAKYKGQIEFIRLPVETQFLLEEVVIYNPEQEVNLHDATKGINGFTYYESRDEDSEGPMHMKIEGELLSFLSEKLDVILRNQGLKFAVERILTEYGEEISNSDKLFLLDLLSCRIISDKSKYEDFISQLSSRDVAGVIDRILSKYCEV